MVLLTMVLLVTAVVQRGEAQAALAASRAGPYAGHCSAFWPGDPKDPGCWAFDWQFSFHPVTTSSPTVGDSSGGLHVNGSWHFFYSCAGGWCHLETQDLVNYESHGIIVPKQSPSYQHPLGLGTGSVTAAADGSGAILAYCNNVGGHMRSTDGMKTWTAFATTTIGSPGGRDQARPLQSSDGTWFQMMGCGKQGDGATASVCRFKANDDTLANWTYDGNLFESNTTWSVMGANWIDFYEVPDFYPLTNAAGVTKHVLVTDPWGQGGPGGAGYHVHNVEWRSGSWSADGSNFSVEQTGVLDYGWWYAARSITTLSNKGSDRRLMSGNIGTDVTHGAGSVGGSVPGAGGIRMFTSLPREISLAADSSTVHVKPPVELSIGLRSGPATKVLVPSFSCGQRSSLGNNVTIGEFQVILDVSSMDEPASQRTGVGRAGQQQVGLYVLASPNMEEAVYVGYDGANVFVDMRNSSQDNKTFQSSFRTSNSAPFRKPKSGVLQLHVFLDRTVIELFASDCSCTGAKALASCECRNSSATALAVTGIAFPMRPSATHAGLYSKCPTAAATEQSVRASALAMVYPVRAAPVKCQPPTCMPPPPPPTPRPPPPPPQRSCPPALHQVPYMAPCQAGAKGQEFTMDTEGTLTSVISPDLALGTTGRSSLVLNRKSNALRFSMAENGNLRFQGGCAANGSCGSGNWTCLDSRCGNQHGGDCLGGIELYACCPSGCACNQEWSVKPVLRAGATTGTVTLTNGMAAPGKPNCHRTQLCLSVCDK